MRANQIHPPFAAAAFCLLAASLATVSALGAASTPAGFEFSTIYVPGSVRTVALGINDRGDVVGVYDTGALPSGFLLRDGVYATLAVPGALLTTAHGINNAGDIVGDFVDVAGSEHGYLLRKGEYTVIDFPGAAATDRLAINAEGDVVGNYFYADAPDVAHTFLLTTDGFKTIAFPGAAETGASAINAKGEIVGVWDNDIFFNFHGYVFTKGRFKTIDCPGAVGELGGSLLTGINSRDELVGYFADAEGNHGYFSDGVRFTQIDVPAGEPGATIAQGINDAGSIVGFYRDAVAQRRRGFVATPIPGEDR